MVIEDKTLARTRLFKGVDLNSVKPLISGCNTKLIPAGSLLLKPDTQNENMFLVLKGEMSIHLENLTHAPIAKVEEGECVGELSAFDGQSPSAYVKAVISSEVLIIPRAILWQLVEVSHPLSCNLLRLLSQRVRSGNEAVNASRQRQKEFEKDATTDPLTGLFNRRWLDTYFKRILAGNALHSEQPELAMLLVDVDNFKHFNDEFGHLVGDVVLRAIAGSLQQNIRPDDIAARVGGEEFVLVFPLTSMQEARLVAERVRNNVELMRLSYENTSLPPVTISIGVAMMKAQDSFVELFAAADAALYQAKSEGRNKVCMAQRLSEQFTPQKDYCTAD
ncbi:MAG: GGDEF domain-containing protein [Sinobacterium sp.]|nr:GGDEF domain-containing protein [Sinobacterium sp.]